MLEITGAKSFPFFVEVYSIGRSFGSFGVGS